MHSLTALTWNLNGSEEAFVLAVNYLTALGVPFVAAFQETPANAISLTPTGPKSPILVAPHASSVPKTGIALVVSHDIARDPVGNVQSSTRLEGIHLLLDGRRLAVAGVHGPDRLNNPTESDRVEWGLSAGAALDEFWQNDPLIVMGDFNANPWSGELMSRRGFLASREADWLEHHREEYKLAFARGTRRPLFNPMWQLAVRTGWAAATYKGRHDDVVCHLIDQIVLSEDFVAKTSSFLPNVLSQMETSTGVTKLVGDDGHLSPGWSDHLPVRLDLQLPEVS